MQTILGANGVIAQNISRALPTYTTDIRQVSRNPRQFNPTDQLMSADLLDAAQTDAAVAGSEIVYLTAGLPYRIKVWEEDWPVLMKNVITSCKKHNAKLVFFTNVYPYGLVKGWMTEETPINPCSRKGEERAKIEAMLMDEVQSGNLQGMLVRGRRLLRPPGLPQLRRWLRLQKPRRRQENPVAHGHKPCATPSATPPTPGPPPPSSATPPRPTARPWHVPTDKNALTGAQFVELASKEFGVQPNIMVLKKYMVQMFGLFNGEAKESVEMLYQSANEYLFDSTKFDNAFHVPPTPYAQGIRRHLSGRQKIKPQRYSPTSSQLQTLPSSSEARK